MQRQSMHLSPEQAAKSSRPRVYRITSAKLKDRKTLRFFVLGCQGKAAAQEKVAQLMNQIAAYPDNKPDFILLLGDNFYDYGVADSHGDDFDAYFYRMYADHENVPHIAGIPCFVILGNHDENIHKKSFLEPEHGIKRGMHQVAHTYNTDKYGETIEKFWLYASHQQGESALDLDTLQPWNMPSRAYSLIFENDQLFCIDSNTYMREYFEYFAKGDKTELSNQARWLAEEMQKAVAAGRNVMLAQHHPLITPGKRALEADSILYFSMDELMKETDHALANEIIDVAKTLFPKIFIDSGYPYHQLLTEILKRQGLQFNTIFTAHDHNIYYVNNCDDAHTDYRICQITSGGGGGSLQRRKYFKDQSKMGCFLDEHGFVKVNCGKINQFSIHTLEQRRHLEFASDHNNALRYYPDNMLGERQKTEKFCGVMKVAIDKYYSFLDGNQKKHFGIFPWKQPTHGAEGVLRANELWAYLCQAEPDSYIETISKVCQKFCEPRFTEPSKYSLVTLINEECSRNYGMDLMGLYKHESQHPSPSASRALPRIIL